MGPPSAHQVSSGRVLLITLSVFHSRPPFVFILGFLRPGSFPPWQHFVSAFPISQDQGGFSLIKVSFLRVFSFSTLSLFGESAIFSRKCLLISHSLKANSPIFSPLLSGDNSSSFFFVKKSAPHRPFCCLTHAPRGASASPRRPPPYRSFPEGPFYLWRFFSLTFIVCSPMATLP